MIDLKLYESFVSSGQNKDISEIFIGVHEITWIIAQGYYHATCTEALNLNPIEKAICGILNIDEGIGLPAVGSILGFNVIEDIKQKKYIDIAEKELVLDTFKTLDKFEMINSVDLEYGSCTLTSIGKEYYSLNKKFKTTTNKGFKIYFDITGNNHHNAKQIFENITKKEEIEDYNAEIRFADETLIKSFAKNQIPEIYDPQLMNSFKDLELIDIKYFYTVIDLIFIFDSENRRPRIKAFDSSDFKELKLLTNYFENNTPLVLEFFNKYKLEDISENKDKVLDKHYYNELVKTNRKLSKLDEYSEKVYFKTEYLNQFKLLPLYSFFNHLEYIISGLSGEIWIMFNSATEALFQLLINIIESNHSREKFIFIYLPNEALEFEVFNHLMECSQKSDNSYIIIKDEVEEFNLVTKLENEWIVLKNETRYISHSSEADQQYRCEFIIRNNIDYEIISDYIDVYRNDFSSAYCENIYKDILTKFNQIDPDEYYKIETFKAFLGIDRKIKPFNNIEKYSSLFDSLNREKEKQYSNILKSRNIYYLNQISRVKEKIFALKKISTKSCENIKKEINAIESNLLENENDLKNETNSIYKELDFITKKITIVLDSDILINEPLVLNNLSNLNILLTDNIIEELNSKVSIKGHEENAKIAIKEVVKSQNKKNIRLTIGNSLNVPKEHRSTKHINALLAIALQYIDNHLLLVTDNKEIEKKSSGLKISTKSLESFKSLLKRRESIKRNN